MLTAAVFFLLAFATIAALVWCRHASCSQDQEDPLADRLEELQSNAMVASPRARPARRTGGGFSTASSTVISLIPGGDGWIEGQREGTEPGRHAQQAGAGASTRSFNSVFMVLLMAGAVWLQRDKAFAPYADRHHARRSCSASCCPKQVLHRLVKRYRRKLQEALPDTVDLLGIVLGTGLALDQAMMRVSDEMQYIYPELASEFYTVVMQVRAGQERAVAFQQLVRRTGIEDIKSLSAMIIQSERFGTSLSQALKVYADALRTRRRLRAEAAVGKAGIKMLFPIVIFILPVLFVITLVPGMLSVLANLKLLGTRPGP